MIRSRILTILVFLSSQVLLAQNDSLNSENSLRMKGFIEPGAKLVSIIGKPTMVYGLRFGMVVDSTLSVGIGGYMMGKDIQTDQPSVHQKPIWLNVQYGGIVLEYINKPEKTFHYTVEFVFGAGHAEFQEHDADLELRDDSFWLIYGGANLEVNALKWMHINCGLGQRYVSGIEMDNFSNTDIGGLYVSFGLRFGKF